MFGREHGSRNEKITINVKVIHNLAGKLFFQTFNNFLTKMRQPKIEIGGFLKILDNKREYCKWLVGSMTYFLECLG